MKRKMKTVRLMATLAILFCPLGACETLYQRRTTHTGPGGTSVITEDPSPADNASQTIGIFSDLYHLKRQIKGR